ncbi:MAG: cyclic nucleotide-binding domain-containing protein [Labilithrix sp.]|nr:cyclic nucleotide-binding domain-containing protein [Labilithrix sp.]
MRMAPPVLPGARTVDSPLDRALALLLAGEREAALRWSAAVVQQDASVPSALILTCRLLADAGRTEAAVEGLELGVKRAIDTGNLPLAVAAVGDLSALGRDVARHLDEIAAAFCQGSPRLSDDATPPPPPLPHDESFQPLSSFLSGPALLSKATEIIHDASKEYDSSADSEAPLIAPLSLFSALEKDGLRALIGCFEMITVPAGKAVISEGEEGAEAYIVARGELEVRRKDEEDGRSLTLARLTNGALFGEMALLSRAPRAASVVANRPSILLVARRDALEAVAEKRPDVGVELAAHCRRRMVANLVRTSKVLLSVASKERPALVERFETKVFEKGDKLIVDGKDTSGLHLIASGEVAVIGREDGGENFVIATLGVGETVGEVALVLRRKANADVVAVHPTVTLHLPREDFLGLVRDHPAILAGLYLCAVERDDETASVLAGSTVALAEDYDLV